MARLLKRRGSAQPGVPGPPEGKGEAEVLRWCREVVSRVGALEPGTRALPDDALRASTDSLRHRLDMGEPPDDLLPEAFAAVREAASRTLGQRHYDVQVMGGAVLHLGKIAEMRTGEGKTLTATLPAYLDALTGAPVHVMTANDYLARRDAEWMGPVYRFLGLSVGLLLPEQNPDRAARRGEYRADVTYGPSSEFGYDYLRDNLAWDRDEIVQRGHRLAIIDEADLILLDEMRAPLQISGPAKQDEARHAEYAALAARLERGEHYDADERTQTVSLTNSGTQVAEKHFGFDNLYAEPNLPFVHHLHNALKAREFYRKDRDYIVADGRAVIVDQTSGRLHHDRRYSGDIHEAIEAKEGLRVRAPMQVLAEIPLWDYLGEYESLAGMTGTAADDAGAYRQIYQLDVVTIPTNKPMIRVDHRDVFYRTPQSKLAALADETAMRHAAGQPVLVGTVSVEQSQELSGLLNERGVAHEMLSARNHADEARILASAGRLGAVTVIAKMAGRGVDIILGGADGADRERVADLGGLCVLGAERPGKRRLETHLRGRAGRQGDPGEAKFYVSFEDDMMKLVMKRVSASLSRSYNREGQAFGAASSMVTKTQASTAARETEWLIKMREFDRVLADQRRLIYAERAPALSGKDLGAQVRQLIDQVSRASVATRDVPKAELARMAGEAASNAQRRYNRRETQLGLAVIRDLERRLILSVLDKGWREHLQAMPELLNTIAVRVQGDAALAEYRREATLAFNQMRRSADTEVVYRLLTIQLTKPGTKSAETGDAAH
jgi:preprotein translocase subunit SecA